MAVVDAAVTKFAKSHYEGLSVEDQDRLKYNKHVEEIRDHEYPMLKGMQASCPSYATTDLVKPT